MKNISKIILTIFLCIALLSTGLMSSCKKSGVDESNEKEKNDDIDYSSKKIYVVQNNTTKYKIIIPDKNTITEKYAAEELSDFIKQSTSVTLPILKESQITATDKFISIGSTNYYDKAKFDINFSLLNGDGFIIKTLNDNIYLKGGTQRGHLYSVYEFLERFSGIKFISDDCTIIPNSDSLYVHTLNIKEIPSFSSRLLSLEQIMTNTTFAARTRTVSAYGGDIDEKGEGFLYDWYDNEVHNYLQLVPTAKYDIPENKSWYSEQKDTICLTQGLTADDEIDETLHESVIKVVIEEIKRRINEKPNAKYFMIGQEDIGSTCACENCKISAVRNGGKSGTMMVFINNVAKAISNWAKTAHPGKTYNIVTFAYRWSLAAPVKDKQGGGYEAFNDNVKPQDNVIVYYAASSSCFYHDICDATCVMNGDSSIQLLQWSSISNRMMIWDYGINFDHHLWLFPNLNSYKGNLEYYKKIGVEYVLSQSAPRESNFYDAKLKAYVQSKLLWDINLDTNDLVKEFNYYYFGEYAYKYIDEYYSLIQKQFAILDLEKSNGIHTTLYDGDLLNFTNYSKGFLEKLVACADNGIDAVNSSNLSINEKNEYIKRLKMVKIQPMYMILNNYSIYYDTTNQSEYAKSFFDLATEIELVNVAENKSLERLRDNYGI